MYSSYLTVVVCGFAAAELLAMFVVERRRVTTYSRKLRWVLSVTRAASTTEQVTT